LHSYRKNEKILTWVLIMLKSIGFTQDTPELTVWIRAGGPAIKTEITSFVQKVLQTLPASVPSKILICTNENDPILDELNTITKTCKIVKVIFSQLNSFSVALTSLAQHTDSESNVLTLSVGINISEDQILTGLKSLTGRVKVYGWLVSDHGNDGSCPGKGWYNTAALLDKRIVQQMKEEIPKWVDNGVLGKIGKHTIGGNEEIPIMVQALQKDPEAKFILNTSDPVYSSLQLGTGVSFQEKLERKIVVGEHYMRKMHQELKKGTDFESWSKYIWASLEII
jgi:hypothetical protein